MPWEFVVDEFHFVVRLCDSKVLAIRLMDCWSKIAELKEFVFNHYENENAKIVLKSC
jgi:hypothetical protein